MVPRVCLLPVCYDCDPFYLVRRRVAVVCDSLMTEPCVGNALNSYNQRDRRKQWIFGPLTSTRKPISYCSPRRGVTVGEHYREAASKNKVSSSY